MLQIIAIIIWYNETKHTEAYDNLKATNKILSYTDSLNTNLLHSQVLFTTYRLNNDSDILTNYGVSLEKANRYLDSLKSETKNKNLLKKVVNKKQKSEVEIRNIKKSIDSIIHLQTTFSIENNLKPINLKPFELKNVLDNVKEDSYIKIDSVSKKRLFSRLSDAFAGRVSVQKEYLNTVVTIQYKDKVSKGTFEEQIATAIGYSNNYYSKQISQLQQSFLNLHENDLLLMKLNTDLLRLTQNKISEYNQDSKLFKKNNQKQLQKELDTAKQVRSYTLIFLILLMIVISLLLFNFTKVAFGYEKRLTVAKNQIKQSLDFKNRITGMVSHEIRSPLNIIALYSRKASATTKDNQLKETFQSIEFTTNSLLLLSNQILEYSKQEKQELKLKNKKIDIQNEINQIIVLMKTLLETKSNRLVVDSNLEPETFVYADVRKIYQLFYNLIGNANKFTEKGIIKIKIRLTPLSDFEMNLDVLIADNGIGISENDLKNIFESYYQGTVSEKVTNLGVGLGLNICKEIVTLFEGTIKIESKVEYGTKVAFNLIVTQD